MNKQDNFFSYPIPVRFFLFGLLVAGFVGFLIASHDYQNVVASSGTLTLDSVCYVSSFFSAVSHLNSSVLVTVLNDENKVVGSYYPKQGCNFPCKKTSTGFDCTDNCWDATYTTTVSCQNCKCNIPSDLYRLFVGDINNLIPIRDSNYWVNLYESE